VKVLECLTRSANQDFDASTTGPFGSRKSQSAAERRHLDASAFRVTILGITLTAHWPARHLRALAMSLLIVYLALTITDAGIPGCELAAGSLAEA
jgi:hypothetical protein